MRKIYPIDHNSTLLPVNCKPITEQQYNDLVDKVNEAEDLTNALSDELEQTKSDLETSIATCDITATNVNANNIVADTVSTDTLTTSTISSPYLTSDSNNTTVCGDLVVDGRAALNCIVTDNTNTYNLTASSATISNLTTDTFNPETIDTCTLTANDISTSCIEATNAVIDNASIDSAFITTTNITDADITEADIQCATIQEEIVQTSTIDCLDNKYLTHTNEPQHISEPGDIWIVLPKFTNGTYVLEAENDGGTKLFSIEVDNSQANLRFKWSVNNNTYLKDVDFVEDVDGVQFLQIHAYTFGQEITLYFHSDSLDNINPPSIYSTKQYEGFKSFDITANKGTYMPNAVFAGDFHAESIIIDETDFNNVNIAYSICLPTCYDVYGCPVGYTSGQVDQYITNCIDENNNRGLTWKSATNTIQEGNTTLVDSNAIANYNGQALDCDGCCIYPISELNECTCVHGSITTNNAIVNNNFTTTNITDIAEDVEQEICSALCLNNPVRTNDGCEFKPIGTVEDGKPIVYNETDDVLETTDSINIDEATFDKITANCAYIQEAHIVKEEQEVTTSDYLTLRANNDSALTSSEYSGVVVNNYDGCNVTGVVSDCTGTIRVGNGEKSDSTYTDIYYADDKWYSDAELTTEITIDGTLTAWSSIEETEDYTHYTNAVFSKIDWSSAEPLLTRGEATSLTDNALLKWDSQGVCATTIAAPTCNEQILTSCITSDTHSYYSLALKIGDRTTCATAPFNDYAIPEGYVGQVQCCFTCTYVSAMVMEASCFDEVEYPEDWKEFGDYIPVVRTGAGVNSCYQPLYRIGSSQTSCSVSPVVAIANEECTLVTPTNYPRVVDCISMNANYMCYVAYDICTAAASCYYWQDKQPTSLIFDTRADYNTYAANNNVPNGTTVYIRCEEDYLMGDDK